MLTTFSKEIGWRMRDHTHITRRYLRHNTTLPWLAQLENIFYVKMFDLLCSLFEEIECVWSIHFSLYICARVTIQRGKLPFDTLGTPQIFFDTSYVFAQQIEWDLGPAPSNITHFITLAHGRYTQKQLKETHRMLWHVKHTLVRICMFLQIHF